ncbi:hypothetical protein BWI97_25295 [Siphonobacter sp. BAB-5405]|uniref:hypothetical protein n=1 Tax=Siphonobacter sp. BAB-5405 TaxID=1864825 RepID=UPI000C80A269|nr:hypothetical protein [Siphonobacter sp. BAB-5405]PMD88529.1 hypothetical protein BWI97_25295 [Siphonobacter sp. BAB-5405]
MHPILSLLVLWFLASMPGTFSPAEDFDQARVFAPVIGREVKNQAGIIQYLPEEKQYVVVVRTPRSSPSPLYDATWPRLITKTDYTYSLTE